MINWNGIRCKIYWDRRQDVGRCDVVGFNTPIVPVDFFWRCDQQFYGLTTNIDVDICRSVMAGRVDVPTLFCKAGLDKTKCFIKNPPNDFDQFVDK